MHLREFGAAVQILPIHLARAPGKQTRMFARRLVFCEDRG